MDADKTLHIFVLDVAFHLVGVQLLAKKHKPISLERPALFLLLEDFSLNMNGILALAIITAVRIIRIENATAGTKTHAIFWYSSDLQTLDTASYICEE